VTGVCGCGGDPLADRGPAGAVVRGCARHGYACRPVTTARADGGGSSALGPVRGSGAEEALPALRRCNARCASRDARPRDWFAPAHVVQGLSPPLGRRSLWDPVERIAPPDERDEVSAFHCLAVEQDLRICSAAAGREVASTILNRTRRPNCVKSSELCRSAVRLPSAHPGLG
jgi:hypothetical protein